MEVIASPFKIINPKDDERRTVTLKDCKNLQQQNNFTNQILGIISSQLDRIEDKLEEPQPQISRQIITPHFLDRNLDKNCPIFKPVEVGNHKLKFSNDLNDLMQTLTDEISQLELSNRVSTSNTKSINMIEEINPENVEQIQAIFEEKDPKINRIAHKFKQQTRTRNYYPRPTLPDLQYEERSQIVQSKYDGDDIYEWNIDGISDHQVLNILQEMIMASTTYKSRGNSDQVICTHLIVGFTSQLKGWWDNALTKEEKRFIQNSLDEIGNQNSVHTLIYAITKHFLGDPISFQSRSSEILQNLHCKKLSDYRWYKEVYFAKVHSRTDCNQPYWKECFLNGLPKVFSQRVQVRIKEMYNGIIPYDSLTCG